MRYTVISINLKKALLIHTKMPLSKYWNIMYIHNRIIFRLLIDINVALDLWGWLFLIENIYTSKYNNRFHRLAGYILQGL